MLEIVTPDRTAELLPFPELADQIAEVILEHEAGAITVPERLVVPIGNDGLLLLMPAADPLVAITKLVTVHPLNAMHNLPSIQGEVIVMDARTGERQLQLDGATVTSRRTAALTLLAAQRLAPRKEGALLIVGAGVQGRSHLDAFRSAFTISEVLITSRTLAKAEVLAAYARQQGLKARVIASAHDAINHGVTDEVAFIVTATNSLTPVLPDSIAGSVFIGAVGAFTSDMAEIPPELIRHCQVFVDTLAGTKNEAGDLLQAEKVGAFSWHHATPLAQVLKSQRAVAPRSTMVLFKSVGHAMFDLAAAKLATKSLSLSRSSGL